MASPIKILEHLIVSNLITDKVFNIGKSKIHDRLITMCFAFVIIAIMFFIAGSYVWLDSVFSTSTALMLTGLITLVFGMVCALSAYSITKIKRMKLESVKNDIYEKVEEFFEQTDREFGAEIAQHPKSAVAMAGAAGFMVGEAITH